MEQVFACIGALSSVLADRSRDALTRTLLSDVRSAEMALHLDELSAVALALFAYVPSFLAGAEQTAVPPVEDPGLRALQAKTSGRERA